jgi:hypothetical protein
MVEERETENIKIGFTFDVFSLSLSHVLPDWRTAPPAPHLSARPSAAFKPPLAGQAANPKMRWERRKTSKEVKPGFDVLVLSCLFGKEGAKGIDTCSIHHN